MVSRFEIKFRNFASSVIGVRDYNINNNDDISKKALLYDFNGAVEQGWKIIKYYLEYVNGIDELGNQSKKIIRAGKDDGLYDESFADSLMEMIDLRNILAHEYDYENIESKCQKIQNFMSVIERLYGIISELRVKYMKYWEKDMIDA